MRTQVNELWSKGEKVTCGVVTEDTRVNSNKSKVLYLKCVDMKFWNRNKYSVDIPMPNRYKMYLVHYNCVCILNFYWEKVRSLRYNDLLKFVENFFNIWVGWGAQEFPFSCVVCFRWHTGHTQLKWISLSRCPLKCGSLTTMATSILKRQLNSCKSYFQGGR